MFLDKTKIVDKVGNPILVSGVVVFYYCDTKKVAIDIQNPWSYISNASQAVLKQIVSKYPFEAQREGQLSLRLHSREIAREITKALANDLNPSGVAVGNPGDGWF
eukprot:TRINITY_DN176_c0_g2_i5.p1 TRINITY_DN176_c0_g2~~TRINITY_DN176_c0_g2_i5.p1  ORF type:complete len:105 (+),score=13.74 TRINITY_DN176_c0_g2_i5:375-689(+)